MGSRAQSPSSRVPPHFLSLSASSFPSFGTHLHYVDILTVGNLENADHPNGFLKTQLDIVTQRESCGLPPGHSDLGFIPLDHTNHLWPLPPTSALSILTVEAVCLSLELTGLGRLWVVRKLQGSSCPCLPRAEVPDAHQHVRLDLSLLFVACTISPSLSFVKEDIGYLGRVAGQMGS